jgi:hypothetical protein
MMDWLAAVDAYLYAVGGLGVEDALCEACVSGRIPERLAGCVAVERELSQRTAEEDGGASEVYRGALTVAGLRYGFECRLFVDSDGSYFVSDIPRFEPVEWQTGIRVA